MLLFAHYAANKYLSLSTADTIVYNARILFVNQCAASCNRIVRWFADIGVYFSFLTVLCILYFNYGLLSEINMNEWSYKLL